MWRLLVKQKINDEYRLKDVTHQLTNIFNTSEDGFIICQTGIVGKYSNSWLDVLICLIEDATGVNFTCYKYSNYYNDILANLHKMLGNCENDSSPVRRIWLGYHEQNFFGDTYDNATSEYLTTKNNWLKLPNSEYLSQVRLYVNQTQKTVLVVKDSRYSLYYNHIITILVTIYNIFKKENKYDDLFNTIGTILTTNTTDNDTKYTAIAGAIIQFLQADPKYEISYKNDFIKLFLKSDENLRNEITNNLSDTNAKIDTYSRYLSEFTVKRDTLIKRLYAIDNTDKEKCEQEAAELYETLQRYKCIKELTVTTDHWSDGGIRFYTETPIEANDTDALVHQIENNIDNSKVQALVKLALIEKKVKLYTTACINLQIHTLKYSASNDESDVMRNRPTKDAYVHPHLTYYNCWGNYKPILAQEFSEHDWNAVIDTMIETASGINSFDTAVTNHLFHDLRNIQDIKAFEYNEIRFSIKDYLKGDIKIETTEEN